MTKKSELTLAEVLNSDWLSTYGKYHYLGLPRRGEEGRRERQWTR